MRKVENEHDSQSSITSETNSALDLFGTNVAHLRKKNKLSQAKLAEKTEIFSQSVISKIEKSTQMPTLDQALRIAKALSVTLDELTGHDFRKYDEQTEKHYPGGTIKGHRPQPEPEILNRYEDSVVYCYYYSGISSSKLREGKLTLTQRCGGEGKFVAGTLVTSSQVYDCKLVVEHPKYIYVFGNNQHNPERMFTVLHEPRYTTQQKPYWGGIGIVVSENSRSNPYVQKVVLSSVKINIEQHQDTLHEYLKMPINNGLGFEITEQEDYIFYDWQQRMRGLSEATSEDA